VLGVMYEFNLLTTLLTIAAVPVPSWNLHVLILVERKISAYMQDALVPIASVHSACCNRSPMG